MIILREIAYDQYFKKRKWPPGALFRYKSSISMKEPCYTILSITKLFFVKFYYVLSL